MVAYIVKLRRKPKGGERLSFAAIAERLNAEATDPEGASMGGGDGPRDCAAALLRPPAKSRRVLS